MKKSTVSALVLSLIVIVISALIILALEPSKKNQPYYHEKAIEDIENFLLSVKNGENSNELLFNELEKIDEDTLKYIIGINPEYLDGFSMQASKNNASTFLILKLKPNSKTEIEKSVIEYMDYLEKQWENTDKDQALLVQNYSKISIEEDYLIYIVSDNNEYIKETINSLFYYTD